MERDVTNVALRRKKSEVFREINLVMQSFNIIFQLGIKPIEEDFLELTPDMERDLKSASGHLNPGVTYLLWSFPSRPHHGKSKLYVSTESKLALLRAARIMDRCVLDRGQTFENYTDQLKFVAAHFDDFLSEGTPFEQKGVHRSVDPSDIPPTNELAIPGFRDIPTEHWHEVLSHRDPKFWTNS